MAEKSEQSKDVQFLEGENNGFSKITKNDTVRGGKSAVLTPLNTEKPLKPLHKTILEYMREANNPTAQKFAENYGVSLRTAKRNIAWLVAHGLLSQARQQPFGNVDGFTKR